MDKPLLHPAAHTPCYPPKAHLPCPTQRTPNHPPPPTHTHTTTIADATARLKRRWPQKHRCHTIGMCSASFSQRRCGIAWHRVYGTLSKKFTTEQKIPVHVDFLTPSLSTK